MWLSISSSCPSTARRRAAGIAGDRFAPLSEPDRFGISRWTWVDASGRAHLSLMNLELTRAGRQTLLDSGPSCRHAMLRLELLAATLGSVLSGATLEYHDGQYDVGCGNGMYVVDAGCGMNSKVQGLINTNWAAGCDLCRRILEQDEWFEGCEDSVQCVETRDILGRGQGIWLKALPAPSPPSPPSAPPPEFPPPPLAPYNWMESICGEGTDPDVCKKRLMIGGAGGAALIGIVAVVATRGTSGGSPLV